MSRRLALIAAALIFAGAGTTVAAELFDAPAPVPPPLEFWQPMRGEAHTIWLPDNEFDTAARRYGIPVTKDGFAIWGLGVRPTIFLRARSLSLFPHEAVHIERGRFHE